MKQVSTSYHFCYNINSLPYSHFYSQNFLIIYIFFNQETTETARISITDFSIPFMSCIRHTTPCASCYYGNIIT